MKKFWEKIQRFWYFRCANPVVREGAYGGFKWRFKRFWLDIETLSGNFKARFTAAEHPYGMLLAGKDDENIKAFCDLIYMVGTLLTTEQEFANSIGGAIKSYLERKTKGAEVKEDETEEKIALEEVKKVQEIVEMPKKERRMYEREVNGRFRKAVKEVARDLQTNRETNRYESD